jgi:hypothetical protein
MITARFPITGGVQGADGPGNSFVWIPSLKAAEMRANVLTQYQNLGMEFTLTDRVATYFPAQPAAGSK